MSILGDQRAYKGHVITLPQDVQQLADVLPRCRKDLPVIIFTVNGKDNQSKGFHVRKQKVSDAQISRYSTTTTGNLLKSYLPTTGN